MVDLALCGGHVKPMEVQVGSNPSVSAEIGEVDAQRVSLRYEGTSSGVSRAACAAGVLAWLRRTPSTTTMLHSVGAPGIRGGLGIECRQQ